ncbi:MAG: hypothetical protein H7066_07650, partial [Cytophagaceae bacterium]|nr:hypothetical protein [Gemmatimonadaceae bacterium]
AAEVAKGGDAALERDILETWAAWYRDALATTEDLEVGGASPGTKRAIAAAQGRVSQALSASLTQLVKRN